ncbi:MAG: polysaccharide biosynthesis/export family protein [Alphaproteobacteria bacterium]
MIRWINAFFPVGATTAFLAFALLLTGSIATSGPAYAQDSGYNDGSYAAADTAYRLGPGDRVRINVFDEPNLSGEYEVGSEGTIGLPLIGEMIVAGYTIREVEYGLSLAYQDGYLVEPRISIEVLNYRPFYILGEVNKPGSYSYEARLTVLKAIVLAGGFTDRANKEKVMLTRIDHLGQTQSYHAEANTIVLPGDIIEIGERFF